MKVLHLVNTNGHHALLLDVAKELGRDGIQVVLGSLDGPGPLQEAAAAAGLATIALGCRTRADQALAIPRLAWMLRQGQFDIVHTHLTEATVVGLAAARLAGVPGRVMTRHHSDERLVYGSRAGVVVDQLIGRLLCQRVVAISDAVERALVEIEGISPEKIRRVPNGYDWARVRSSPAAAGAVRQELGLGDHFVLCHVGRIAWVPARQRYMKGQDQLLRAVAAAGLPAGTRILIVGVGDEPGLKKIAHELGLGERCLFLGHRRDCFDVMAAADLIVHPSLHEAQCQVIIEALALGRPVISSDVGAARDIVLPGWTGWLVPSQDEEALARALREAEADRARLQAFGEAGRGLVRELYPIEKMARGYAALYEELLSTRPPR